MQARHALQLLFLAVFGLGVSTVPAPSEARGRELTLVVADLGIRQKPAWRQNGDDGLGWVHPELPRDARIGLVMPDAEKFGAMSTEALQAILFEQLKQRVAAARAAGRERIEIQLVEDIGVGGYFDPSRQGRQQEVDRFGAAAYGAIVDLNRFLAQQGVNVRNEAVVASNGTKVWAANVAHWLLDGQSIWAAVDLFDGRAEAAPAIRAIRQAGSHIVRIFNTRDDWWALDVAGFGKWVATAGLKEDFFQSIASLRTTTAMKDLLPGLRVYYLRREDAGDAHISGTRPGAVFSVSEYLGGGLGHVALPGRFTGRDLRADRALPAAPRRDSLAARQAAAGRIAIWREVAVDMANLLLGYANEMHEKSRGADPALQFVALAMQAHKLRLAVRKEIDDAAGAPVVSVSHEFVESLLRFSLGVIDARVRLKLGTGEGLKNATLLDGVIDIGAFAMSVASQGTVDAEAAKKLQSGTLKLGRDQLLAQARRSLERLHDIPALQAGVAGAPWDRALRLELAKSRAKVDATHRQIAALLLVLDSLPEFSAAMMAQQAAGGRWTVDVVDRYSDAVITLIVSVFVASQVQRVPVLGHFAGSARDALVMSLRYARDTAKRSPEHWSVRWLSSPQRAAIYDQFAAYIERQRLAGEEAMLFTQFMPRADLALAGIRDTEMDAMDERVRAKNALRVLGAGTAGVPDAERRRLAESGPVAAEPALRLPAPRTETLPPPETKSKPLDPPPPPPPPPPPVVGGGPPPPGSPPPAAGSNDPPERSGTPIGGIVLGTTASTADPLLAQVEALAFDPLTGRLALVGREGAATLSLNEHDLAWALHLQFGPQPQDPQFSLDAADPANVDGPWLKAVYWPQQLKGSAFGETLFSADHLMKQIGLGIELRVDGSVAERAAVVPGFASVPDLMRRATATGDAARTRPQWARYWIVSERMEIQQVDRVLRFADARMAVRARRQVPDAGSRTGLRDVATAPDTLEAQWAAQLSARYDEVAGRLPEFARVTELAKAVAIAKWLKGLGVQVEPGWIDARLQQRTGPGTERVPALSATFREESRRPFHDARGSGVETTVRTIRVFGGVDLSVTPTLHDADARTRELAQAVAVAWKKHPDSARFELVSGGRVLVARVVGVALPQAGRRP